MVQKLNHRSIKPGAKEIGLIAENAFQSAYPDAMRNPNEKGQWDFMLNGHKIDVKSKMVISLPAQPHWQVSVSDDQKYFDSEFYFFVYISKRTHETEFVGWISKKDYFKKAKLRKQGEIDFSNGFVSPKDNWFLPISELNHEFKRSSK